MRPKHTYQDGHVDEVDYARVETAILDLQLSISSVRRANTCFDLDAVQRIRGNASQALRASELRLRRLRAEPAQAQRLAERHRCLALLLREPAPIERLARTLHVG